MIRINLLKEEPTAPAIAEKEEVIKEKKPFPMTSLLGLFIVAAFALGFLQVKAIKKEKTRLNEVQEEKEKLKDVLVKLERVQEQQDLIIRKIDLINQLKSQQGVAVSILDELSKNIPYWVWLTEASFNKKTLFLKGKALSNNLIADYTSNLEKSPFFKNINFISSAQKKQKDSKYFEFSLTTQFVPPSPPKAVIGELAKSEKK